jgi:hypothetical protein
MRIKPRVRRSGRGMPQLRAGLLGRLQLRVSELERERSRTAVSHPRDARSDDDLTDRTRRRE